MAHKKPTFIMTLLLAAFALMSAAQAATHTLTISAEHGSVAATPQKASYNDGEVVQLVARPETGYCFTGWSGAVRGKQPALTVTMNGNKSITASFGTWQPPVGIPAPDFGITETYRVYDNPTNRNGALTYTRNAEGGYYTHYIDSTHPSATDSGNDYGSVSVPRQTIPKPLPPGSVVEIHNACAANGFGYCLVHGEGTVDQPIFVRGVGEPRMEFQIEIGFYGDAKYIVVDGLSCFGAFVLGRQDGHSFTTSCISIRNCNFYGSADHNGGIRVTSWTDNPVSHVVLYDNVSHDNGVWDPLVAEGDQDFQGCSVVGKVDHFWAVDNEFYHNSGDGLQMNAGNRATQPEMHHMYIGRNVSHHNKQAGLWTKQAVDVVFSQNVVYGQRNSSSAYGAGMGFQYAPERVWFLFNTIYDCEFGIALSSDSELGTGTESYFVGNLIYDIHYDPAYHDSGSYNPDTAWAPAAIMMAGGVNRNVIGNTIYDVDAGINVPSRGSAYIANNIIVDVGTQGESHIWIEDLVGSFVWEVESNLLYQSGGAGRIKHYTTVYTASTVPAANGSGNIDGDPEFVDAGVDFGLDAASPAGAAARSTGTVQEVYDLFSQRYGIDIRKDIEGATLVAPWDIGAYKLPNRAPALAAIGDKTAPAEELLTFSISATDPDGEAVTYSASGLPSGASFSGSTFSWTPTAGQVGTYEVTFVASDGTNQDSEVVTITVISDTNQAPILASIGNRSVNEGATLAFTVSASDVDNDPLSYLVSGLPAGATYSNRTFNWTPGYAQAGSYSTTFIVSDGHVQDSEAITITVNNVNRAPSLRSIGNRSVAENSLLSFSLSASDPDGDSLTYSSSSLPSGATFSGPSFAWTPTYEQMGSYAVTFTASDGAMQDSETMTISVTNVNRPPALEAIANQSAAHGTPLTFAIGATDPDGDTLTYSASGLPTGAIFEGQTFGWTPTPSQAGTYHVTFSVSDGHASDSQNVSIAVSDTTPPSVTGMSPAVGSVQVPLDSLLSLHVVDAGIGVDADTVVIKLNGNTIYDGDTAEYTSGNGVCRRTGTAADYAYAYQPAHEYDFDQTMTITVDAADLGDVTMSPYSYSFTTEMWAFGPNRSASWGPVGADKGHPATVCDSRGTVWAVYHAGPSGQRDIYLSSMAADAGTFSGPIQLTADVGDQSFPDIAVGSDDTLYVVWQDSRRGNWDIYGQTSTDGVHWSTATRITTSDAHQTAPALAVGCQLPSIVYVAWQDGQAGHEDIYMASSSNGFATNSTTRVTSDATDQTAPDIAVDLAGTVYLAWTDARNGSNDIYGADSATGPWANVALVTGAGQQHSPALATEATGSVLHLVWVDEAAGHGDVRYACSNGMPATPLAGIDIVDDTSDTSQLEPTVAVVGSTDAALEVFVSWQDWRNMGPGNIDSDLYFVDVETGDETNVLVGDGETNSPQSEPALGVDQLGYPYVVWTDSRNVNREIYYAGSTRMDPAPLTSGTITAAVGGTVGSLSPAGVGDVSVAIAGGASPHDVDVSISEMQNPPSVSSEAILVYEFSPSGLEFSEPVTITVPYAVADFPDGTPTPYWYDTQTGTLSQQGISNIERIEISATVRAVRFRTTHFTPYGLFEAAAGDGGGGGGGGCALAPVGQQGDVLGCLLPYLAVIGVVVALRCRDRRVRLRT